MFEPITVDVSASHQAARVSIPLTGTGVDTASLDALDLSGAGQSLAAWVAEACSYSDAAGPQSGPVLARVLHTGRFAAPITPTPATTQSARADAVPIPGGAVVTWLSYDRGNVAPTSVPTAANGAIGATSEGDRLTVRFAANGAGDLLLEPETAVAGPASAIVVRPADGGADQAAPVSAGRAAPLRRGE